MDPAASLRGRRTAVAGEEERMATTYAASCMMCGRSLGYAIQGTFVTASGSPRPKRHGRHLRCGYCRGAVMFEPDPTLPRDWAAEIRREEVAQIAQRRVDHRRAG
jgi:hypothetical protein